MGATEAADTVAHDASALTRVTTFWVETVG